MTPQQLIGVGVRLFAAWLALTSIPYLIAIPNALASMPMAGGERASALSHIIAVAYLFGALLLWFFPMVVANRLVPRTQFTNHLSFQAQELARVGCALLGLWLFAKALSSFIWFMFRSFLVVGSSSSYSALDAQSRVELAVAAVELGFAVFVIAKARAFAKWVVPEEKPLAVTADDL